MLHFGLFNSDLEELRNKLLNLFEKNKETIEEYRLAQAEILSKDYGEIISFVRNKSECEAIPSEEFSEAKLSVSFEVGKSWQNQEQIQKWASEVLSRRTTFGVDGGQDFVGKELGLPIAIVQIGWFINSHTCPPRYEKNHKPHLIMLNEMREPYEMQPENYIGHTRFALEIAKAREFLESKEGWKSRGERMPVVFFDGALIVSLSRREVQGEIAYQIVELIELSRKTQVPVVGYVDRSYSSELVSLFKLFSQSERLTIDDLSLISHLEILPNCGDRTIFFYSRRRDLNVLFGEREFPQIGFVYLRTTSDSLAARLDVPSWVFEEGFLNEVVDVVRAECFASRQGYPYCLASADQAACITTREREHFIATLQNLMQKHEVKIGLSRKTLSKKVKRSF